MKTTRNAMYNLRRRGGFFLLFILVLTSTLAYAQKMADSISSIDLQIGSLENSSGSQLGLVDLLLKKTEILLNASSLDDALITANEALLVSNEIKSESVSERVNGILSICYMRKNLIQESLDYLYKGYEISEALRDTSKISWYLLQICRNEEYIGRLAYSMNINLKAIEFFRTIHNYQNLGQIYRMQAVVHIGLGNFNTAENYIDQATELLLQYNDSLQLGMAYLNRAELELLRDEIECAQVQVELAKGVLKGFDEKYLLRCNSVEGAILLQNRKTLQATLLLNSTAKRQLAIEDTKGLVITLIRLGDANQRVGDYTSAINEYNLCIKNASAHNLTNYVRKSYQGLAKIHGKLLQYQLAYTNLNRYVNITDSLYNLQTIGEVNRLENQAAIRAKERQIDVQNELIISNRRSLKREKMKQLYLYLLIGLSFVVIVIAVREFLQKKRANNILIRKNGEIDSQRRTLEQRNRDIKDSLNYAKRIQRAVLRTTQQPNDLFGDSFLLFQPKELVSGDFYWFKKVGNQLLFAVADCTGHGAPGAFMSIIGTFGLNQVVSEFGETRPAEILNYLSDLFYKSIEQREGAEIFDGMDIGLCCLDTTTNEIKFAGANIGLNIVRKTSAPAASSVVLYQSDEYTLYQTKFNKQSIGYVVDRTAFTTQGLHLLPNDCLYLFTDGYTDQFGGPKIKKLGYGSLRSTLCDIASCSMDEQKDILLNKFNKWKDTNIQIDDVTFLGIRIPE